MRSRRRTKRMSRKIMMNGEDKEKKEGWERGKGEVKGVSRRRKQNREEEYEVQEEEEVQV